MHLSWQPGFSLSRKPEKRSAPRRNKQQQFEFVMEDPQRACRARHYLSPFAFTHSGTSCDSPRDHSNIADPQTVHYQSEGVEENEPPIEPSLKTLNDELSIMSEGSPELETISGMSNPHLNTCNNQYQSTSSPSPKFTAGEHGAAGPGLNAVAVPALTNNSSPLSIFVPPTIEYSSLTQRYQPVLDRCMCFVHTFLLPSSY